MSLGGDFYEITNANNGLCLGISDSGRFSNGYPIFVDGARVIQNNCLNGSLQGNIWRMSSPILGNHFNLMSSNSSNFLNYCMTVANNSGSDGTAVVVHPCNPGDIFAENRLQTWQFG